MMISRKRLRSISAMALVASMITFTGCSNTSNTSTPSSTTTTTSSPVGMDHSMHGKKININSAILSELDKLEAKLGVPALSNKIQASRPYGNTDELVSKNVITQEQYDQIKEMVTIEDVVLTGEAKDVDYMTKLGLMKGHMIVAKELLDLNKPDQAEPHIGHPVEEIYADVEDQLSERNVPEFKDNLIALQDLVKAGAKDSTKVGTEFKGSITSIDTAIAALPEAQRQSPSFILQVINGLLDTANSEYGAAVANNKIAQIIEYQDSRGFVLYAQELYKAIAPQMEKEHGAAHQTIQTTMTELSKAWPAVEPPATPVKTTDEVSQLIKKIEQSSQSVSKP